MDLNDPVVMAQAVVEIEAEAVRREAATKPIQMFQRGMLTVEELIQLLYGVLDDNP